MYELIEQLLKKAGFTRAKDYTLVPDDGTIRWSLKQELAMGKKRPKPRPPKR